MKMIMIIDRRADEKLKTLRYLKSPGELKKLSHSDFSENQTVRASVKMITSPKKDTPKLTKYPYLVRELMYIYTYIYIYVVLELLKKMDKVP